MFAILLMTNPLWQFIIAPFGLIGIGYWLRGALDRYDDRNPGTPGPYNPSVISPGRVDLTEPQIRILGPDRGPYDWEKEDTDDT
jgi:hypothetical protein